MKLKMLCSALLLGVVSSAYAGPVLIVSGSSTTSELGTTNAVVDNLSNLHTQAGNVVTIVDGLPTSLVGYSQVWDVRFNFGLDAGAITAFSDFLGSGGGLFLMGENSSFMERNNSILSLISSLGGGDLGFNACFDGTQTVRDPFNGPNVVSSVSYAAAGCFNNKGSGQWITARADDSTGSGIAFSVGSLSFAPKGALTSILDVNFMMNSFDLPNSQNFTKNLIQFVGDQVEPPSGVPEPSVLALFGIAALGAFSARRLKAG